MPLSNYIILIKFHRFDSFLDGWGFNPIILNQLYRRRYSYLCRFPLILNVYMNWLMIIGVKEKSNPKYKRNHPKQAVWVGMKKISRGLFVRFFVVVW